MMKLADFTVNGSLKIKQLRLICCSFELMYLVMMVDIEEVCLLEESDDALASISNHR